MRACAFSVGLWQKEARRKLWFCRQAPRSGCWSTGLCRLGLTLDFQNDGAAVQKHILRGLSPCSPGSQFFDGGIMLRADCETLMSRLDEGNGRRLL